jgi:chaperonin GroES
MAKKIYPRGKFVLIEQVPKESGKTESGLVIPDNVDREQRAQGTVIRVGELITDIKKGDEVIYGAFSGDEIEFDGKTYRLVEDEFIIGILK